MAHVAKYNRSASGHMLKHYERAKDENGDYIKFGNENINTTKSDMNYNLAPNKTQMEFLKERCNQVQCLNRKDVNVMCSWVVSLPKTIQLDQEKEFFKQTYEFLENRYGKDNVISAYVHKDEITPHMHYAFIPVTFDKKKDKYKVSAKEVVNKRDLQTFHKDLDKHLEHYFGYPVGILNEATKDGDKSVLELKKQTVAEELEEVKAKYSRLQEASQKLSKGSKDIKGLSDKLRQINPGKTLIGNKLTLTEEEYSILISIANQGGKKIKENIVLQSNVNTLKRKLEELEREQNRKSMYEEINQIKLKDYDKIKRENRELKQNFKRVEQAIDNLDMIDKVNSEIKTIKSHENAMERKKSFGIDR